MEARGKVEEGFVVGEIVGEIARGLQSFLKVRELLPSFGCR